MTAGGPLRCCVSSKQALQFRLAPNNIDGNYLPFVFSRIAVGHPLKVRIIVIEDSNKDNFTIDNIATDDLELKETFLAIQGKFLILFLIFD